MIYRVFHFWTFGIGWLTISRDDLGIKPKRKRAYNLSLFPGRPFGEDSAVAWLLSASMFTRLPEALITLQTEILVC